MYKPKILKSRNGGSAIDMVQSKHPVLTHVAWINLINELRQLGLESKLQGPMLDIGCGDGSFLAGLKMHDNQISIYGIDSDLDCLKFGKSRYGRAAKFVNADFRRMPFRDESFNFAYSNNIYDDYRTLYNFQVMLAREIYRILRPE
ncbi:class I SAM-dependent methyltransferase, partial [Candidatus Woesearchaeota archaeon]|nr:class I SAM-dependent methyltransferase [Candidatus Woesearchaeota archaeon]